MGNTDDNDAIENHPDLMDPDWRKHAEKEAWTEVRRSRKPRYGRRLLWTFGALVVVVAAAAGWYWLGPQPENSDATLGEVPTSSALPSLVPRAQVDLNQPFQYTPASGWSEGLTGLTTPAPAKTGDFSVEQVASAIDKVKQLIFAGHLDRRVLETHDTTAFLGLITPNEQESLKALLAKPDKNEASYYVTFLADGFRLLPAEPRVNGRMSVRAGQSGELIVNAEYVVAYAFNTDRPAELTGPGDIVAFERTKIDYTLRTSPPFEKRDAGYSVGAGESSMYSIACGPAKLGYLAPAYSEPHLTADPRPETNDAAQYDVNQPMPQDNTCGS